MSIERAERLKRELTDQWVVVAADAPELRRFANLTGKVRTVNMNCRALVEFDGPADIGWYDIDPSFLKVVDSPQPKVKTAAAEKPVSKPPATAKPGAAAAKTGGSPLDKIRAAGAGVAPAAAPQSGGSPLDKIRAAGAGNKASTPAPEPSPADVEEAPPVPAAALPAAALPAAALPAAALPAAALPAAEPAPTAASTAKPPATGSPLDQIRAMGPAKN